MIRDFFSYKFDSQGVVDVKLHERIKAIFSDTKIGQNTKLMEKEYGQHPVIYIDMKDSDEGDTYEDFLAKLRFITSGLYHKFAYLTTEKSPLADNEKKEINYYVDNMRGLTSTDLSSSLLNLSRILNSYHKKKVIILMDEYDSAYNHLFTDPDVTTKERRKIIKFLYAFYKTTFKGNDYLNKSLMTGVLRFAKDGTMSALSDVDEHDITSWQFSQFYGFTRDEVEEIFGKFRVTNDVVKETISAWYDGYFQGATDVQVNVYCPWSVIKYFNNLILRSYWTKTGTVAFLDKLLWNPTIKRCIEQLIKGGAIEFEYNDELSAVQFENLSEMAQDPSKEINSNGIDVFFSYLFVSGYLTQTNTRGVYILPNFEITKELENKLRTYYEKIYTIDPAKMGQLTDHLRLVLGGYDSLKIKNLFEGDFYDTLSDVIKSCDLTEDKSNDTPGLFGNEDFLVHSLLNFIALQVYKKNFATEIYMKKSVDGKVTSRSGRADIMLSDKHRGLIIEMKYTKLADKGTSLCDTNAITCNDALKQAKMYSELISSNGVESYMQIFCGISISSNQDVALSGEIIILDKKNKSDLVFAKC
jgi:hypothetical protein